MDMNKVIPFFIALSIIMLIFDFYFLNKWTKFVKLRIWNKLFYKIPWGFAGLMVILLVITSWQKFITTKPNEISNLFYFLSVVWYLPKLIIVPVILIKDFFRFLFKYKKLNRLKLSNLKVIENNDIKLNSGRRKFLQTAGWGLAGIPFIAVTDGLVRTTYNFKVYNVPINLKKLPVKFNGFKIVQISDLHAGSFDSHKPFTNTVNIVNSLKPDMIVITGDFVNFKPSELEEFIPDFKKLSAPFGVYGCLGNHDHYMNSIKHQKLLEMLNSAGVRLLINENVPIQKDGETFYLAGSDSSSYKQYYADFTKTLDGIYSEYPIILLCHDPTNWDRSIRGKTSVDLMLAGHTHGGQIGIDIFGEQYSPARLLYEQWAGLYSDKDQYLYVNCGLGITGPPLRIGIPPEITLFTLHNTNYRLDVLDFQRSLV